MLKELKHIAGVIDSAIAHGTTVAIDGPDLVVVGTAIDKMIVDLEMVQRCVLLLAAGAESDDTIEDLDEDTEGEIVE